MSAGFYTSLFWLAVFFGLFLLGCIPDTKKMKERIRNKVKDE